MRGFSIKTAIKTAKKITAKDVAVGESVFTDLKGASALVIDAITGVTTVVEDLHHKITSFSPLIARPEFEGTKDEQTRVDQPMRKHPNLRDQPAGRTRGITGFVYGSIRTITRGVGFAINFALTRLDAQFSSNLATSPERDAIKSAINGVIGDRLAATSNSLAIQAQLRVHAGNINSAPRPDRKSTRLNSSHVSQSRMPSSA